MLGRHLLLEDANGYTDRIGPEPPCLLIDAQAPQASAVIAHSQPGRASGLSSRGQTSILDSKIPKPKGQGRRAPIASAAPLGVTPANGQLDHSDSAD